MKFGKLLGFVLIVGVALLGFGVYNQIDKMEVHAIDAGKYDYDKSELKRNSKVKNILLIGLDEKNDDSNSRSDSIIILSIDKIHEKLKITSILRDSYLEIPGKGKMKINAAFANGGADLLIATIEDNFKFKIDGYFIFDFEVFKDIIDAVGGVDVTVSEKESDFLKKAHKVDVPAGYNTLDGEQALWYSRLRKLDSDFGRTRRQRDVIKSLGGKFKELDIGAVYSLFKDITPRLKTSFNKGEFALLGLGSFFTYNNYQFEEFATPVEGAYKQAKIKKQDVLVLDVEKNRKAILEFIYEES